MEEDLAYQRVVVMLRKKQTNKLIMKSFKFIPRDSLTVTFPENTKRMGSLNSFVMYGALLSLVHVNFKKIILKYDPSEVKLRSYCIAAMSHLIFFRKIYNVYFVNLTELFSKV